MSKLRFQEVRWTLWFRCTNLQIWEIFRQFQLKIFPAETSKLHSKRLAEFFHERILQIDFGRIFFQIWAEKRWTLAEKFWAWSSKLHWTCPEEQFRFKKHEKPIKLFRSLSENFSDFKRQILDKLFKTSSYVSTGRFHSRKKWKASCFCSNKSRVWT